MSLASRDARARASPNGTGEAAPGGPSTREGWLAGEVPNILAGLESSREVSRRTARTARLLCESGDYETALSLLLGEALGDR